MIKKYSIISDLLLSLLIGLALTPFITLFLIMTESYTKIGNVDIITVGLIVIPCVILILPFIFRNRNKTTQKDNKS